MITFPIGIRKRNALLIRGAFLFFRCLPKMWLGIRRLGLYGCFVSAFDVLTIDNVRRVRHCSLQSVRYASRNPQPGLRDIAEIHIGAVEYVVGIDE